METQACNGKINNKFIAFTKTKPIKKSWACANVPCKIISINGSNITVLPFNSKNTLCISTNEEGKEFIYLESDDNYVYIQNYPDGKVLITEFDVKPISLTKLKKHFTDKNILKAIEKAELDSYHSKGKNSCITVKAYNDHKNDPKTSKLERFGDQIFNRSVRHSPPISKTFTREHFENSLSYPAPIGVREEDFAWPSEQNEILIELLNQIFSCKNAPECPEEIKKELGLTIIANSHMCFWCGEIMDLSDLKQEYCLKEHTINFCHRNPEIGTKKKNIYIGHCSCNREQGGYSEEQRVEQIIKLAKFNPNYREKILKELSQM
jgi:hypothetical protein